MLFLSGQTARDPKTGDLVTGDVAVQTERVMENLKAVLEAAGLKFSHVVRCTVFLTDMADFPKMNEVRPIFRRHSSGAHNRPGFGNAN
jgi:2-iminobutanoate/2-iminopropanoate deaminase